MCIFLATGNTDCVSMLIDKGSNIDAVNKEGWTPYELSYSPEI